MVDISNVAHAAHPAAIAPGAKCKLSRFLESSLSTSTRASEENGTGCPLSGPGGDKKNETSSTCLSHLICCSLAGYLPVSADLLQLV